MTSIAFLVTLSVLWFAPTRDPANVETILLRMSPIPVALILAFLIALYRKKKANERMQIMQGAAAQLGWPFCAEAPWNYIPGLDRFTLFTQGHSKHIKNMMYGEARGTKAAVFDYIYTTGSGKNSATFYQSVVYLEPASLNLPYFSLR